MKDITRIKIWPLLQKEGFLPKEYRFNNIKFGRGATLVPNINQPQKIEIEPLTNGKWKLSIDSETSGTVWEKNAFELSKMLPKKIEKFKNRLS